MVVATHRRAHLLPRLVAAIEAQTLGSQQIQLVLVDDGSGDETTDVARALARGPSALDVEVVALAVNGGPAVARNAGCQRARAAIVAFTDDDCVPTPQWLEEGLEALDAGADVVAGRTLPAPDQSGGLGPFARTIRAEDGQFVQTCNAFYRRADLERLGGFDERMRTGEDTELALRAAESGAVIRYAARAIVHHDVRPSSLAASLRETARWSDLPRVVARHPQVRRTLLHRRFFWKPSHPPTIVALAGIAAALAGRRPSALAGAAPWLVHRLLTAPLSTDPTARLVTLPGAFAVDSLEVAVMLYGSVKHRTLLL